MLNNHYGTKFEQRFTFFPKFLNNYYHTKFEFEKKRLIHYLTVCLHYEMKLLYLYAKKHKMKK